MEQRQHTIAMFGESEKGEYRTAYFCQNLTDLADYLGHPPDDSRGLYFAVQALMYRHRLIFFRVQEEGYSLQDYILGLRLLENQTLIPDLSAVCLPGVGDAEIIDASTSLCLSHKSILITTEADLYDYLTHGQPDSLED